MKRELFDQPAKISLEFGDRVSANLFSDPANRQIRVSFMVDNGRLSQADDLFRVHPAQHKEAQRISAKIRSELNGIGKRLVSLARGKAMPVIHEQLAYEKGAATHDLVITVPAGMHYDETYARVNMALTRGEKRVKTYGKLKDILEPAASQAQIDSDALAYAQRITDRQEPDQAPTYGPHWVDEAEAAPALPRKLNKAIDKWVAKRAGRDEDGYRAITASAQKKSAPDQDNTPELESPASQAAEELLRKTLQQRPRSGGRRHG